MSATTMPCRFGTTQREVNLRSFPGLVFKNLLTHSQRLGILLGSSHAQLRCSTILGSLRLAAVAFARSITDSMVFPFPHALRRLHP